MDKRAQSSLLVINLGGEVPRPLADGLPSFEVTTATGAANGLESLRERSFDCVMMLDPDGSRIRAELVREVEQICGDDITPCILAAAAGAARRRLVEISFDGFVDCGWPTPAIDANLRAMVRRVQAGRNVVEVQRIVLNAAQVEMDTLRLKEELAARSQDLLDAQEQLFQSQKLAALTSLAAGVAHEVNNPLAAVIGFAQVLRLTLDEMGVEEDLRIMVATLEEEALRIAEIIKTLTRFSDGHGASVHGQADIHAELDASLNVIANSLEELGIEVIRIYEKDLPPVTGSSADLHQAFLHILDNARTAMPSGGRLRLTTASVDRQLVKISIADTGRGIERQDLEKIFEPFFTTKDDWRARGLGLTVAHRVVSEHHGTIKARSAVGAGTTITITLPAAKKGAHLI